MVWDETDDEWSSQVSVRVCVPLQAEVKEGGGLLREFWGTQLCSSLAG